METKQKEMVKQSKSQGQGRSDLLKIWFNLVTFLRIKLLHDLTLEKSSIPPSSNYFLDKKDQSFSTLFTQHPN